MESLKKYTACNRTLINHLNGPIPKKFEVAGLLGCCGVGYFRVSGDLYEFYLRIYRIKPNQPEVGVTFNNVGRMAFDLVQFIFLLFEFASP